MFINKIVYPQLIKLIPTMDQALSFFKGKKIYILTFFKYQLLK